MSFPCRVPRRENLVGQLGSGVLPGPSRSGQEGLGLWGRQTQLQGPSYVMCVVGVEGSSPRAQLCHVCSWGGGQLSYVLEENEDPFSIRSGACLLPGLQEGGLGGLPGHQLEVEWPENILQGHLDTLES